MSKFKFIEGELPERKPAGRGPSDLLAEFVEECRARPGVWAEYPSSLKPSSQRNIAWMLRSGSLHAPMAFRDGGFDATVRRGALYVRFVGGES